MKERPRVGDILISRFGAFVGEVYIPKGEKHVVTKADQGAWSYESDPPSWFTLSWWGQTSFTIAWTKLSDEFDLLK